ncbi:hypothetical protein [Flavobacterium sp. ZT3R18]|nr:hypothetical protein [Flavobacterium sp. ZT3R18]
MSLEGLGVGEFRWFRRIMSLEGLEAGEFESLNSLYEIKTR